MPVPRRLHTWYTHLPRGVRVLVGVVAIALGVVVLARPTTSLGFLALLIGVALIVTGVLVFVGAGRDDPDNTPSRWRILAAAVWTAAGVFVLVFPGLTVRTVAVVVGASLIIDGLVSIITSFRRAATLDARVAAVLVGIAGIIFGALALAWPDITLLVVAVVFGARLILTGVLEVWRGVRGREFRRRGTRPARSPGLFRRWVITVAAVAALVLAVGAAALSAGLRGGSPVVDDFYAAPRIVPDQPGSLVRAEPFTRAVPDNAQAWRILYTTTNSDGQPTLASGLVVVPRGDGDREGWPVITWTHGTTGFDPTCAPSLQAEPFESGALMILPEIIDAGWAVVATDYIGLGTPGPHPYLIGEPSAHAALDATRAALDLQGATLKEATVIWGHSQGGGAALWAGAVAEEYAPELPILGVAALAPAANLPGLIDNLPNVTGGSIFASFVVAAYTSTYNDVTWREYVRPGAEATVRAMSERCLAPPGVFVSVLEVLGLSQDPEIFAADPTAGAFGDRLRQNIPPATISAPLLLGQGAADSLVVPTAQDAFVAQLCNAGQDVDYRLYEGRDHVPLVEPDSPLIPELFDWTTARFAGEPSKAGCTRTTTAE